MPRKSNVEEKEITSAVGAYLDAANLADLGRLAAKTNGQCSTALAMKNLRQELFRRAQDAAMRQRKGG